MIMFIYGEDSFSSRQKLRQIKAAFIEKHGDLNLLEIDGASLDNFSGLKEACETMPFLGEKRLVIVNNFLTKSRKEILAEEITSYLPAVPDTCVLLFYESEQPDKRRKLFKQLETKAQKYGFAPKTDFEIRDWAKKDLAAAGFSISSDALAALALAVEGDLWRLSMELNKLKLYKDQEKNIEASDVKKMVKSKVSSNIFDLTDALGNKNTKKAAEELHNLYETGENEFYILSMLNFQFRNLASVRDLLDKHVADNEIAKITGLHPFVVKKSLAQVRNFTINRLKMAYDLLVNMDKKIKQSRLDPRTALDLFIVETTK